MSPLTRKLIEDGLKPRQDALAHHRLRDAAPDLLAELRRVTEHLDTWARDHAEEATAETWAALHCARAAIAKATGQTQERAA